MAWLCLLLLLAHLVRRPDRYVGGSSKPLPLLLPLTFRAIHGRHSLCSLPILFEMAKQVLQIYSTHLICFNRPEDGKEEKAGADAWLT